MLTVRARRWDRRSGRPQSGTLGAGSCEFDRPLYPFSGATPTRRRQDRLDAAARRIARALADISERLRDAD
jgi:hypothetical protein